MNTLPGYGTTPTLYAISVIHLHMFQCASLQILFKNQVGNKDEGRRENNGEREVENGRII